MMDELICSDCNRKCGALRNELKGNGYCGCGLLPQIALAKPHYGEEPCISGIKGSGTVFFSGCTLKCAFCQNYDISHESKGKVITCDQLAKTIKALEETGVHNINLVNPTHYIRAIDKAFEIYKPNVPIVYNTNSYETAESVVFASKWTDVFLADLKLYSQSRCKRYLSASNYFESADRAIDMMLKLRPQNTFENGIITSGVIIRILILPCNTDEAYKIADHIYNKWGNRVLISLMCQYYPAGAVSDKNLPEINRCLTKNEYQRVFDYYASKGFDTGFYQQFYSANGAMTPDFNFEGIVYE